MANTPSARVACAFCGGALDPDDNTRGAHAGCLADFERARAESHLDERDQ